MKNPKAAGALAGLAAGLVSSGIMAVGRDSGVLQKTLSEHAEDWLDERFALRRRFGDDGLQFVEQVNHLAGAAAFGAAYGAIQPRVRHVPALVSGAAYGGLLYLVAIAGIAPLIGLTQGEERAPSRVAGQRLALHLLFGIVTALATEALLDRAPRKVDAIDAANAEAAKGAPTLPPASDLPFG